MDEYIIALLTTVVGAVGYAVRQWLKTVLTPRRLNALISMARAAIAGAEEVGNVLELGPAEKLAYAENALRDLSKRLGLRLTESEVNALIHAILYEEHQVEAALINYAPEDAEVAA